MEQAMQEHINNQVALTLGRQAIELIAAQATITALQQRVRELEATLQEKAA